MTTGIAAQYTNTPTGNYVIQDRVRNTTLTLITGATYAVNYWIPFEAPLFGFHDSSWQNFPYGSPHYKTRARTAAYTCRCSDRVPVPLVGPPHRRPHLLTLHPRSRDSRPSLRHVVAAR